jgi:hypothetical protein
VSLDFQERNPYKKRKEFCEKENACSSKKHAKINTGEEQDEYSKQSLSWV